jgi:hypothetical protein
VISAVGQAVGHATRPLRIPHGPAASRRGAPAPSYDSDHRGGLAEPHWRSVVVYLPYPCCLSGSSARGAGRARWHRRHERDGRRPALPESRCRAPTTGHAAAFAHRTGGGGLPAGVGSVIVAQFGEPIADETNAEKRLPVTTYPKLTGSWNWKWDQWRRRNAPSTETESG